MFCDDVSNPNLLLKLIGFNWLKSGFKSFICDAVVSMMSLGGGDSDIFGESASLQRYFF
jgi:hypothetical protein